MTNPVARPADGPAPTEGFAVFDTAIGTCSLAWGSHGLTRVLLPERSADAVRASLRTEFPGVGETVPPTAIRQAIGRIRDLLAGGPDDLADIPLDLGGIADFALRVYRVTRTIPPGSTLTYGEVAARIGMPGAAQAVGRALGANPFPIVIPCHRILGAGGAIGGFSAPGGARTKRRMLLIEGAGGTRSTEGRESDDGDPARVGPGLFGVDALYETGQAVTDQW